MKNCFQNSYNNINSSRIILILKKYSRISKLRMDIKRGDSMTYFSKLGFEFTISD